MASSEDVPDQPLGVDDQEPSTGKGGETEINEVQQDTRKRSDLDSNYSSNFDDEQHDDKEETAENTASAVDDGEKEDDNDSAADARDDFAGGIDATSEYTAGIPADDGSETGDADNKSAGENEADDQADDGEKEQESVAASQASINSSKLSEHANDENAEALAAKEGENAEANEQDADVRNESVQGSQASLRSDTHTTGIAVTGAADMDHEQNDDESNPNDDAETKSQTSIKSSNISNHSKDSATPLGSQTCIKREEGSNDNIRSSQASLRSQHSQSSKHSIIDNQSIKSKDEVNVVAAGIVVADLERKDDENKDDFSEKGSVKTEFIGNDDIIAKEEDCSDKESTSSDSSSDDDNQNKFVYELFDSSSDEEMKGRKLRRQETKLTILDYPAFATEFSSLHIHEELVRGVNEAGFEKPTELQSTCLPQAMKWRDCIIQGPPGVGKSMAYVLSTLHLLPRTLNRASARTGVRVLVVCPTRELVASVEQQYRLVSKHMGNVSVITLTGGKSAKKDDSNIRRMRPNIIIGTPGRIAASIKEKKLSLSLMKTLVIEQADMMLNPLIKEFRVFFQKLLAKNKKKQMILTCTTPFSDLQRVRELTKDPFEHLTDSKELIPKKLDQYIVVVSKDDSDDEEIVTKQKQEHLYKILDNVDFNQAIIFVNTSKECDQVLQYMLDSNFAAFSIHGSMTSHDRIDNHEQFRLANKRLLVTTDALCREVVSDKVNLVINYDHTSDKHTYLHRVSKAVPSLACTKGVAVTFVLNSSEIQDVEDEFGFTAKELPADLSVLLASVEVKKNKTEDTELAPVNENNGDAQQTEHQEINVFDDWDEPGVQPEAAGYVEVVQVEKQASAPPPPEEEQQEEQPQRLPTPTQTESAVTPEPPPPEEEQQEQRQPTPTQTETVATPEPAPRAATPHSRHSSAASHRSNRVAPEPNPYQQPQQRQPTPVQAARSPSPKPKALESNNNTTANTSPSRKPVTVMGFADPKQSGPSKEEKSGSCTCVIL